MTREEHIAQAKAKALELLPDNPDLAIGTIVAELRNHEQTAAEAVRTGLRLSRELLEHDSIFLLRQAIEDLK